MNSHNYEGPVPLYPQMIPSQKIRKFLKITNLFSAGLQMISRRSQTVIAVLHSERMNTFR